MRVFYRLMCKFFEFSHYFITAYLNINGLHLPGFPSQNYFSQSVLIVMFRFYFRGFFSSTSYRVFFPITFTFSLCFIYFAFALYAFFVLSLNRAFMYPRSSTEKRSFTYKNINSRKKIAEQQKMTEQTESHVRKAETFSQLFCFSLFSCVCCFCSALQQFFFFQTFSVDWHFSVSVS